MALLWYHVSSTSPGRRCDNGSGLFAVEYNPASSAIAPRSVHTWHQSVVQWLSDVSDQITQHLFLASLLGCMDDRAVNRVQPTWSTLDLSHVDPPWSLYRPWQHGMLPVCPV